MSNSVVKVTESSLNDSLFLLVGEDGTVTPDRKTVESFLSTRDGPTDLQVMHISKSDGKTIEMSIDDLTYINSDDLDDLPEEMDEVAQNLFSIRLDHDYTPLTSPRQQSPVQDLEQVDELAQTLSILDGSNLEEHNVITQKQVKVVKVNAKSSAKKVQPVKNTNTLQNKAKTKVSDFKQPKVSPKPIKPKPKSEETGNSDDNDEDYVVELSDDENDSDFECDETTFKHRPSRRMATRIKPQMKKLIKPPKVQKQESKEFSPKQLESEPQLAEKETEVASTSENKQEKKQLKKEKKPLKPVPEDFALFSTPDIIRRVGGKEPLTPTTPSTPESPSAIKSAKISPENRTPSIEQKRTRLSTETRTTEKVTKGDVDNKTRRPSMEKTKIVQKSPLDIKKIEISPSKAQVTDMVQIQNVSDSTNSSDTIAENVEQVPTAEDIRSIILNENTKSFTTSLVLPENNEMNNMQQNVEQNINMDPTGLDLDQSILDNINSDLISEDILYQVAKQLVDNTDLQNVIDKSLVDGNLVLDPSIQNVITPNEPTMNQQSVSAVQGFQENYTPSTQKGTQIVRPDGRIVVIPPIERPTTRSSNRKQESLSLKPVFKPTNKPLDEEHVSGNELDSSESEEEDKSEDDPDKLWCICNQPHNNRFMICCDTCEEWYHGKCVNVTKAMGQLMEQEGKEWICVYCKDPALKRPKAAARRIRKASRASTDSSGSAQKSSSTSAIISEEPLTKSPATGSSSTKSVLACIVCGKPSRKGSIYCSEACILKHAQGVEKVTEKIVVFDRASGKILSGNKAPTAANIEKWLQEHPSYEVVRSANKSVPATKTLTQSKLKFVKNTGNEGISLALSKKGVNIGVLHHLPKNQQAKQVQQNKQPVKANITSVKILNRQTVLNQQLQPVQLKGKLIHVQNKGVRQPQGSPSLTPVKPKTIQTTLKGSVTPTNKDRPVPQKTPKSRQAEQPAQPKQENIREMVCKTLSEQLLLRLKESTDLTLTEEEVNNISTEIESQLYKCFGDTGQKYKNKYRSLIFNIKDTKNQTLWRRICEKAINPYQLVRLSPDDLASQELALWREREAKHQLDMIKKSELELLNCSRQYVFKTHKGEQVLEDGRPNDAIDSTEVITSLGADSTSIDTTDSKHESKDKDKKNSSKHSRRDKERDLRSSKEKTSSDHKKDRGSSKDRDKRRRSRSKDRSSRHSERRRSKSRDRHRRSSHKTSRHKKDSQPSTEKLDKKSKEILDQLVDKQIVPPLEDRLWKHVQQEDITSAPHVESDSDHEPTSTVTIPTPPRNIDQDEDQQSRSAEYVPSKERKKEELSALSVTKEVDGSQSPVRPPPEFVWKGSISMVDVAHISITAHVVSGDCNGLGEELPSHLEIVGRISPDTVWDYIGKMKCSNSKVISLIRLNATNVEEKMPYIALYSYLSSRNRLGVVKSTNKAVKDFYILPLAVQKPIPQALLPISGPGFEESRPPLLLGIIVRDKRKRPLIVDPPPVTKKVRVEIDLPPEPTVAPPPVTRSYTPPPSRDPRVKATYTPAPVATVPLPTPLEDVKQDEPADDMDEPYSPEDSDPETIPAVSEATAVTDSSSRLNAGDLSDIINAPVKASSFLESGLSTQTFEPFANKFDTIPGLDDTTSINLELQRKMAELDQKIAMQKAEIDNMSHDIVSTASADIGTSALANIALPSNLQQILDSIKTIGAVTPTDSQDSQGSSSENTASSGIPTSSDLTIPLLLPKVSTRAQKSEIPTNTIPLNLPTKTKRRPLSPPLIDPEKVSVLSSLSEEDLIRKAAEMLGESSDNNSVKKAKSSPTPAAVVFSPNVPPPVSHLITPSVKPVPTTNPPSASKRPKLDLPPVPGLEDEI